MKLPQLRFSHFTGEWQVNKLSSICTLVTSGSRDWAQYYAKNGAKFIRMTNLSRSGINLDLENLKYVKLPNNTSEGSRTALRSGDILISITAELGKVGYVPRNIGEAYINQHTALIRVNETKASSKWVAYNIATNKSNKKLNRLNDSGAKAGLNLGTISSFKIVSPIKEEQEKIAEFLTKIDERIGIIDKKLKLLIKYKKDVAQKIFTQQIRFKDENGNSYPAWQERKLGDILIEKNEKSKYSNQYDILSSTAGGLFLQSEYFKKDIASNNNAGYKILRINQIVFSPQNLWMGNINYNERFESGIVSPSYKIFDIKNVSKLYIRQIIKSPRMLYEYSQVSEQGASIVRRNLDIPSFLNIKLKLPGLNEQEKIATLLAALDDKIKIEQTHLTKVKQWKKGLLMRMFV